MIIKITIRFLIALIAVSGFLIAGADAPARYQLAVSSAGTVVFCIGVWLAGLTLKKEKKL